MRPMLTASPRKAGCKGELNRLRKSGYVPASVYGKGIPPLAVAVEEQALQRALRRLDNHILEMDIPGHGLHPVLIKEIQRDKVEGGRILHLDFFRISMSEPVRATVRIELVGEPAGLGKGVVLQQTLESLEVKAMPQDLPGSVTADAGGLAPGDTLTVADLLMPPGVMCLTDPATPVATVLEVQALDEADLAEMKAEAESGGPKASAGAETSGS
mgnify:FL=1